MADIKSLDRTLRTNNSATKKIVHELTEIRKALHDTDRRLVLESLEPHQTRNSPYFPDRDYSNQLAVKGNAEETAWKEVPTYESQRNDLVDTGVTKSGDSYVVVNQKKLNII